MATVETHESTCSVLLIIKFPDLKLFLMPKQMTLLPEDAVGIHHRKMQEISSSSDNLGITILRNGPRKPTIATVTEIKDNFIRLEDITTLTKPKSIQYLILILRIHDFKGTIQLRYLNA